MTPRSALLVALVLVLSTAAGSLLGGLYGYHLAKGSLVSKDDLIAGCNANSEARVWILRFGNDLRDINQGRVDAGKGTGQRDQVDANRYARRQYERDRDGFQDAFNDAAINPGGDGPNSVRTDCEARYR